MLCLLRRVLALCALVPVLASAAASAQTAVSDPAVPVTVVPTRDSAQVFAVNKDRTLLGTATTQTSSYSLRCAAPAGLATPADPASSVVFNEGPRFLFETGVGTTGTNALVGVGADFSGTSCMNTPAIAFYGTTVSKVARDRRNRRVLTISANGSGSQDVVTSFATGNAGTYYAPGSITKEGQASLDIGGTYTAMVPDGDGTVGYVAITQLRTATNAGGLWIYDPSLRRTVKILGPGGTDLPAINAFILHNPQSTGGGLLVLSNQDLLTTANLGNPPAVAAPFTLIDMGQLGALLQAKPSATTVTLPTVTTIAATSSYYAIFASEFNPVDNKLYLLIGTGTSATNPIRQVLRYDPFTPAAPGELAVADASAVPLYPGSLPQIALPGAANTLQILTGSPNTVYTVALARGDTAVPISGTVFGDTGFNPTAIAANPLLGETYIASASGNLDIVTRPATLQPRAAIVLNGPLSVATAGQSTSLQIESIFPIYDASLSTTPLTLTATAQSTGKSFTFASPNTADTLSPTRYISGTFPTADIYSVVASFPGTATYAAFSGPAVKVAVGVPLNTTSLTVVASASSQTAGTATVTLSGANYTPTGTITIADAATQATLATQTITLGNFVNPISVNFTIPAGTKAITASYSGDANNSASTSAAAPIPFPVVKSDTTLAISGPGAVLPNAAFSVKVVLGSANGNVPTGTVILNATPTGSSASQVGSTTTTQAFGAGTTISVTLPAGTYTLQATYAGDANFNATASNSLTVVSAASTTPAVSLNPTSLTFTANTGTTSAYQNVTLTNSGGGALTISSIVASGTGFAQVNGCPTLLAPGANCVIRVNFSPTAAGSVTGAVTITDNAAGSPHTVSLTGSASVPVGFFGTPTTTFTTDQVLGTSSIARPVLTVTNNTSAAFTPNITLDNRTDFEQGPGCTGGSLAPGSSCSLIVTFHPATAAGAKSGTFTLSGAPGGNLTVTFKGNGIAAGTCADFDGDALCDDWEVNGYWARIPNAPDQFVDLPKMGAKANHKDIFLHIDSMQTGNQYAAHSHIPKSDAIQTLINSFANAPVVNGDGTTGIAMHVDCGASCYTGVGGISGTLSKTVLVPEYEVLDDTKFDPNTGAFSWARYDSNATAFAATGRALAFHHVLMAHTQHPGYYSSGISRNPDDPNFFKGGSDLTVTLGVTPSFNGTSLQQTGTIMHELGHNLGLAHGGQDFDNYKPNFLSIMNYLFQFNGIPVNGHDGLMDYSENALPSLNERALNEVTGIPADAKTYPAVGPIPAVDSLGTLFYCLGDVPGNVAPQRVNRLNGPINWDCINDPKGKPPITYVSPVISNINGDYATNGKGIASTLASYKDWPKLVFSGGAVGGNGSSTSLPAATTGQFEATQDVISLSSPLDAVMVVGPNALATTPGSTMTLRFTVKNTGQNDDQFTLSLDSMNGWARTTLTPANLTLASGTSTDVTVAYTVPLTAAAGDQDRITLRARSVANPRSTDQADLYATATASPLPLSLSTGSIVFGAQPTGASSAASVVQVVNTGTAAVAFSSIAATAEFTATSDCAPALAPGTTCTVRVLFAPAAAGARTGTLTLASSAGTPLTVTLNGTGVVSQARPIVLLTVTPVATSTGQTVTFSANVAAVAGGAVPTGIVTFTNVDQVLGTATLDAGGNAVFTSSALGAGTYTVYAQYAGDAAYTAANTDATTLTIVQATPSILTLTASATVVQTGAPVTFTAAVGGASTVATGTVTFLDGGKAIGTGTLNAQGQASFTTSALAAGPHTITATYPGDAFYAASAGGPLTETVGVFATATSLSAASNVVTLGTTASFTATVTSAGGIPTGTVNFLEGTKVLGTVTLDATSKAAFSTATLAAGAHTVTAQYTGTGNYTASTSLGATIAVVGPDFTVVSTPAQLTLTHGTTATLALAVTPFNGYAGTVKLSCGTLPQYASCSFSPAQLSFTAATTVAQTATLTIDTTAHASAALLLPGEHQNTLSLAALLGVLVGGLRMARRRIRRLGLALVLAGFGLLGMVGLGGCGTGAQMPMTTPAGTYTVTVTVGDGTTAHAVNIPITVQ